jgi:hypothetical protein
LGHKKEKRHFKQPYAAVPTSGQPRTLHDPENKEEFVYRLGNIDHEGNWGWNNLRSCWKKVLGQLDHIQTMTWNEILKADGGRSSGTNSHPLKVSELNKCAIQRLQELEQNDLDEIFSLRVGGKDRVYGIKHGKFLDILWFDNDHGDNDTCVCRSHKKNT